MRLTRQNSGLVVIAPLATLAVFAMTAIMTSVTITVAPVSTAHDACHEFHFGFGNFTVLIEIGHLETMEPTCRELVLINNAIFAGSMFKVAGAPTFAVAAALFVTGFAFRAACLMARHTFGVPRLVERVGFFFGKGAIAVGVGGTEVCRNFRVNFIPRDAAIAIRVEVGEAFLHEAFAAGARALRAALRISEAGRHGRRHNHSQKGYLFHFHVSVRIAHQRGPQDPSF